MPPPSSASSSKALAAILPQISAGHAYEAHQKARTFAARYVKSNQHSVAIDVLFQSARELLKAGQLGSGTDLGIFMVDVYENKSEAVTDESLARLTQLITLTGPSGTWRKTLIDRAVAWSVKAGPCPSGDQDLHHFLGELFFKEGSFELAEGHLIHAGKRDSARLLAQMMSEWWQALHPPTAAGAFALRGTLPHLLNGNILAARTFISTFVALSIAARPELRSTVQPSPLLIPGVSPADEVSLTSDTVLNFLQLAVRTCQRAVGGNNRAAREAWVKLNVWYVSKGGYLTNPEVRRFLSEIASLYFEISPPRSQAVNPFDMLSSMFGGVPTTAPAPRTLVPPTAIEGVD